MQHVQEIIQAHGGLPALQRNYLRLENPPFMRLVIEVVGPMFTNGSCEVSVAHYGEQNGDSMRDPEITFFVTPTEESVEARTADGKAVRVGFSNSYRGTTNEAALLSVIGAHAARFLQQSFEIKIKGDAIPDAAVEPLLAELQALFARHGATSALVAKAVFKPNKEFHTARHTLFTPQQNAEIDKVLPIGASVKTKLGRGGDDE